MTARTFGKALLYATAGVVALGLLAMLALKVALDHAPAYQNEIEAWVREQTGYHIRFAHVWPAFRRYGPELYFQRLELRSKDDRRVLARAAGGRIAVDVWQLLRSGKLLAGRVQLDAPEIAIARVGSNRFALAAEIELHGEAASDAAITLDDFPAGKLAIRHGRLTVQNWNSALPLLVLDSVDLDLSRESDAISLVVAVKLPPLLGGTLIAAGQAQGVGDIAALSWQIVGHARDVSFRGWHELLPDYLSNLEAGSGAFDIAASGRGAVVSAANLTFSASGVVTKVSEYSAATFDRISGILSLDHSGDRWQLRGRDVRALRSKHSDPVAQFDVSWRGGPAGLLELRARTSYLHADTLMPLTGLVPDQDIRERLRDIAPSGEWSDASLEMSRATADAAWKLAVRGKFSAVGFAPAGRAPGFRGLSGMIEGTDSGGRIDLDSYSVLVVWPHQWPQPATLDTLTGAILWRRTPDGLLVATPTLAAANRDLKVRARAAWEVSSDADSPRLTLVADLDEGNAAAAHAYLPRAQLPPKIVAWLNRAFIAGRMPHGQVVFRGPVRHFPFRDGSGTFLARLTMNGLTLDYADGWPRIENLSGQAEFHNEGFTTQFRSAPSGGIAIASGDARFADFKTGELEMRAKLAGDAGGALRFLRATPLEAMSNRAFSAADASGPMTSTVELFFPFKQFDQRRVVVDNHFEGVTLNPAGSSVAATALAGDVEVRGAQVAQADVRGWLFGGAFRMQARAPRNRPVTRTQLDFRGTVNADLLRSGLGLPASIAVRGLIDWRAVLKMAPAPAREDSLRITSTLSGLESKLPDPLGKTYGSPLPSSVELQWPPAGPTQGRFALGTMMRGIFEVTRDAAGWRLARAGIALGGGEPVMSDAQVVTIGGKIQRLNLTDWQRFRYGGGSSSRPLGTFVRNVHLEISELDYLGLTFRELGVDLAGSDAEWRIAANGPQVVGTIRLPVADPTLPWELEFERLLLTEAARPSVRLNGGFANVSSEAHGADTRGADARGAESIVDPRSVPAIRFRAQDLTWDGRHLGTVQAAISKVDDGVTLDRLTAITPTFSVTAQGDWRGKGAGLGRLEGALASTDVETSMVQLGYADVISAKTGRLDFNFNWVGAPTTDSLAEAIGHLQVALDKGQVLGLKPGAGRVLGLSSIAALPRRLALDFSDLTDKGLAFDSVRGDFDLRGGNAYTDNMLMKGPAAEIGLIGRIGLKNKDYDQIAVVTGSLGNSLAAPLAGVLVGGPVVGAAVFVFAQVFKQPLRGLARGYYRITGGWDNPTVERIKSADVAAATAEVAK